MFSFGFNEEDLNDETAGRAVPQTSSESHAQTLLKADPVAPPQFHQLESLLESMKDLKISFRRSTTPRNNVVFKRELFDIKHQVMTEDNEELNALLIENNQSDLNKDSYEGGFKVWECSYDLIDHLSSKALNSHGVLEIGSGTSLPSCFLFRNKLISGDKSGLELILSDFNYDVLRLVTLPNILINWACYKVPDDTNADHGEITVDAALVGAFLEDLKEFNMQLKFISGSWSNAFLQLVKDTKLDLVLSCETIYSVDSLNILAHIINELTAGNPNLLSLVAAKNYYFGVGGSVVEFNKVLTSYGLNYNTLEVSSQLKRSIIEIGCSV